MGHLDVAGYLRTLGCHPEPLSLDALRRLHAAHVERVPYTSLDIQLGQAISLGPGRSAARILRGRGGYCFHLNGAFATLLTALGYTVHRHRAGIHNRRTPPGLHGNHLTLTVTGLPEQPQATWPVDVGLGDALHHPMRLHIGEHRQGRTPTTSAGQPRCPAAGAWTITPATASSAWTSPLLTPRSPTSPPNTTGCPPHQTLPTPGSVDRTP